MTQPHTFKRSLQHNKSYGLTSSENGTALIEMALTMPAALLFIFGLFYFCVALFDYSGVIYGTRAAARYAALHSASSLTPATTTSITNVAKACLIASLAADVTSTVTYSPSSSNQVGNTVQVSVKVNVPFFIPFMKGSSMTVGSSSLRTITR